MGTGEKPDKLILVRSVATTYAGGIVAGSAEGMLKGGRNRESPTVSREMDLFFVRRLRYRRSSGLASEQKPLREDHPRFPSSAPVRPSLRSAEPPLLFLNDNEADNNLKLNVVGQSARYAAPSAAARCGVETSECGAQSLSGIRRCYLFPYRERQLPLSVTRGNAAAVLVDQPRCFLKSNFAVGSVGATRDRGCTMGLHWCRFRGSM